MADIYDPTKKPIVYVKPDEKTRPNDYIESVEKSGMLVDATRCIAMYTSRAGHPNGANSVIFDTIIASCSDEFSPITVGGPKTTFRAPYPLDLSAGYVRASLTTACTGAVMTIRLTMNGVDLFTTPITIDAGSKTSVGAAIPSVIDPALVLVPDDAEFLVYVDTVGSIFAGSGLKIAVTGVKV